MEWYEKSLNTFDQLGDLANKATSIYNIGGVCFFQDNDSEALKMFNDALQILIQIGLSESSLAKKIKKNIENDIRQKDFLYLFSNFKQLKKW